MRLDRTSTERGRDALAVRGAALEYWFIHFHAGDLGFLVDFIARRKPSPTVEVRVSRWVRGIGAVVREVGTPAEGQSLVASHVATFDATRSVGHVADCSWDLSWDVGRFVVSSKPWFFGPFEPTDISLIALPEATFNGWVEVAGERFEVAGRPGAVTHYWGRRLADRWIWISASDFPGEPQRRLEAGIAWTRTWGRGPALPVGYLWTTDGEHADLMRSPVSGLARIDRSYRAGPERASVAVTTVRPLGARHRIEVSAPVSAFNDLGEGIQQTLLADLSLDGLPARPGSVGFELRGRQPAS
jgi:hypothetical protein